MDMKKVSRREVLKGVGAAAFGAVLAACAPTPTTTEPSGGEMAETPAPESSRVTLQVWGFSSDVIRAIPFFEQYSEMHDNVVFESTEQTQLSQVAKLGLQAGSVDILLNDPGWAVQDPLIRAGLLRPIEDYWEQYNWDDVFTDYGKTAISYKGTVYGVPNQVAFIAQEYNVPVFKEHGLTGEENPQTYDEWLDILKTLKEGGEIPLIFGLRSGVQTDHMWAPFVQAAIGRRGMEELLFGEGKWTDPGIVEATYRCLAVQEAGYLDPSGMALDYTEAQARFNAGKNPIWFSGVWANAPIAQALGGAENLNFMTVPPWDESVPLGYPGGIGSVYSIATSSKHADIAADLFNFMFATEEGQRMWVEDQLIFPPIKADISTFNLNALQVKQTEVGNLPDGVGYWLVVYFPPELLDPWEQGFVGVLNGQVTPEAWLAEIQAGWEKGIEEGTVPR